MPAPILNEAYYGKNENILRIEALLGIIADKIKKDKSINPNYEKEVEEIEKLIETQFNFQKVNFAIDGESNGLNAYTYPYFYNSAFSKKEQMLIKETNGGLRYASPTGKELAIVMSRYGLLNQTPAQNMAILLHEIGHNFYIAPFVYKKRRLRLQVFNFMKRMDSINKFYKKRASRKKTADEKLRNKASQADNSMTVFLLVLMLFLKLFAMILQAVASRNFDFIKFIRQHIKTVMQQYRGKMNNADRQLNEIMQYIYANSEAFKGQAASRLIFAPFSLYLATMFKANEMQSYGYDAERFCDTFAVSYGYGKEIAETFATSNVKYMQQLDNEHDVDILESMLISNAFAYFSDEHPSSLFRVKQAEKKLMYELNNNNTKLTPEMKKDIKEQLLVIKSLLDDKNNVILGTQRMLNKKFNYDDRKDAKFSKTSDKDIFDFEKGLLKEFIVDGNPRQDVSDKEPEFKW